MFSADNMMNDFDEISIGLDFLLSASYGASAEMELPFLSADNVINDFDEISIGPDFLLSASHGASAEMESLFLCSIVMPNAMPL